MAKKAVAQNETVRDIVTQFMEKFENGEAAIDIRYTVNDDGSYNFKFFAMHDPWPWDPTWLTFDTDTHAIRIENITKEVFDDPEAMAVLGLPENFGDF